MPVLIAVGVLPIPEMLAIVGPTEGADATLWVGRELLVILRYAR
jgi:hypothetical protein